MDYILKNLDRKIQVLSSLGNKSELQEHYQARYEYTLMLILGYLWNKNFEGLNTDDRSYVAEKILKPSIGTIVDLIRKLDIEKEFYGNKKIQQAIDKYPALRNEKLGHGYTFEDKSHELISLLGELYNSIVDNKTPLVSDNLDLINVIESGNGMAKGIRYVYDGSDYLPWSCSHEVYLFDKIGLYGYSEYRGYFRIAPFVLIEDDSEYYIFSSI